MRVIFARVSILSVCVLAVSAPMRGQSPTLTSVPRLVRVASTFRPADGQPPAPVERMTLSIYGEETGGVPLWKETQTVAVNPDGRFTLFMGSTRPEGLPLDLFASGEPRWLAVHVERPGEGEPGRVLLTSVPSALGANAGQTSTGDPKAPIKPKREDFDTLEAYEAAKDNYYEDLTDYKVKQGITKALAERKAEKQRSDDLERRLAALEGVNQTLGVDASQNQTRSVAAAKAVKEDTVKEETVKPVATQQDKPVETQHDLSWTKGDFKIEPFGAVRLDAYYDSARTQGPGMPAFLTPKLPGGFREATIALNARNSMVGLLFTGPDIGKFHSGGKISAVFVDNTNVFADRNGFMLTQSYGELFNDKWRFAAGLQLDVFAPNLPTVLPFTADGTPIGNTIKGQIRVERFLKLGSDSQLTLQGAVSEPLNSINTPDVQLDEDNGWPNVEGRIAFGLGKPSRLGLLTQRPVEIGVSGVVGQLRRTTIEPPRRVVSETFGVNVDFRVNLADRYGFKGEVYTGQGLGQMGGGIVQSLDAVTFKAIRSKGGWVEGYVYLTPNLHNHTGIFIDDPNNNDITGLPNTLFGRTYNRAFFNTLLWDLGGETKKFRIGLEFALRKTEYKDPTGTGRFPNSGFEIHPQFQWLF